MNTDPQFRQEVARCASQMRVRLEGLTTKYTPQAIAVALADELARYLRLGSAHSGDAKWTVDTVQTHLESIVFGRD